MSKLLGYWKIGSFITRVPLFIGNTLSGIDRCINKANEKEKRNSIWDQQCEAFFFTVSICKATSYAIIWPIFLPYAIIKKQTNEPKYIEARDYEYKYEISSKEN